MATFTVPYLVVKPLAAGGWGYYWQPSPALARKGWKGVNLGASASQNDQDRIDAAKRRNAEVDAWRAGGATPRTIKKFTRTATMAALIQLYRDSDEWTKLAGSTRGTYLSALNIVEVWATDPRQPGGDGNLQLMAIGRERVEKLRDALMKPARKGAPPRHYRAHNTLRVLRTLLQFAVDKKLIEINPAERFKLAAPAPRDQIWETADVAAFAAAAAAIGYPALAFAVELAEYTGQREADILTMNASQWREVHNLDRETHAALAGADGRVMGIFIRQGKTKRWVGIPIAGAVRARIEAAIAANAARDVPTTAILVNDLNGRPWQKRQFIHKFVEAKLRAAKAGRAELVDLQFRDLRRTCVVRLGELGLEDALIAAITGHMLGSIKTILEVYMPRTNKMAGRAVMARIGGAARDAETRPAPARLSTVGIPPIVSSE